MLGSSCYCLNLGFVVVKRSFSGGNQEEGTPCLHSYLISSLLPKSISSHLLHCVTSLPFGSVWEWEAWRQKEGKRKKTNHQNSSKVPPSATGTLCSRKTEPALPPASVLVGHCPGAGPLSLCHTRVALQSTQRRRGLSVSCGPGAATGGAAAVGGVGVCQQWEQDLGGDTVAQGSVTVTAGTLVGRVQDLGGVECGVVGSGWE